MAITYDEYIALVSLAEEQKCGNIPESLYTKGLVCSNVITESGLNALEPYRAKRAIFLAAGMGTRMRPLTINTPKPMVRVHGKRIIETILEAVTATGINEIWIVRGYLGEEFELLKTKYPNIHFIENEVYNGTGTISSVYRVRDLLENAYVLESDLVVNNPSVIKKYHWRSDYLGAKVDETDDWYLRTDNEGTIVDIGVNAEGENLYKLVGISYWSSEDGKKLKKDLEKAYDSENGEKLSWSRIPFVINKDHYQAGIAVCELNDVTEIDSFKELQDFDETYR